MSRRVRLSSLRNSIRCLIFAAGILTCYTLAPASEPLQGKSIGKEAIIPVMMEDHSDSFIAWRRAKVKQRTVVHIDGHIDLEWISDSDLKRIFAARTEAEIKRLQLDPLHFEERSLRPLTIMNYLYPAIREGMIKALYWALPDALLTGDSLLKQFKDHLVETLGRVSIEDLESFKVQKGVIKGKIYGIPLIVCKLSDLPSFREAVILDIDVDYFDPPMEEGRVGTPSIWPEEMVALLRAKRIRTDIVSICYSVKGGYLPLEYKFLGDDLADLLKRSGDRSPHLIQIRKHKRSGHVFRSKKMDEEAAQEFQKALTLDPQDASLHYGLGMVYRHLGKVDEASVELSQAIALDPIYNNALPFDADYLVNKGMYEEALGLQEEVLVKNPRYLKAVYEAGFCSSHLGKLEKAIEHYQTFVTLYPNFYLAHFNLGVVYSRQKQFGNEEKAYGRALKLNPYFAKAYQNLGMLYMTQGELERAIRSLKKAVEMNPSLKEAHNNLGTLYARTGKEAEAIDEFKKSVRIDPSYAMAHSNLGKGYLMQGKIEDAIRSFQHAIRADPQNLWARYYLGQSHIMRKQYAEAIPVYEEIIQIDPKFFPAYFDLAMILGQNEMEVPRALKLAQKAAELQPGAETFSLLASLYFKNGLYAEADRAADRALALDPRHESTIYLKEMIRKKMGNR
jgi:tetratricopeptide (TPR) repeat protein